MSTKILFTVLFSFICSSYGSDVLDLGDDNFKSTVDAADIILVEFFAPWCGHCKRLAPEYEIAATKLKKADPAVPIAKVDCTEAGKEVCGQQGVSGYPTLKIFKKGKLFKDYDGERNAEGIVAHMKKLSGPSSVLIKDVEHLEAKLKSAEDSLIVGFFDGEDKQYNVFMEVASKRSLEFAFAHSTNKDVLAHAGHSNVVVLYRPTHLHAKFENKKEVFEQDNFIGDQLEDFIEANLVGMVGHMQPNVEKYFKKPLFTAYYLVDYVRNPKGTNYYRNRVARVAKKFVGKAYFSIASKGDYSKKLEDLQFDVSSESVAVVANNAAGENFVMKDVFSPAALESFVNEVLDGKVKPYIKSEEVPESNDGPVKVVVGETFNSIVNDPTKDVLIEFYAPWCGHCKTLEPKFNELGEKLKGVEHVVIAKMDATANDVPQPYEVTGFPTIYWSPMGSKDAPKKYESGREVDDFVAYVKKESSMPVELTKKKSKKSKAPEEL